MRAPCIPIELGVDSLGMLSRCVAIQGPVDAMLVIVIAEGFELPREVDAVQVTPASLATFSITPRYF